MGGKGLGRRLHAICTTIVLSMILLGVFASTPQTHATTTSATRNFSFKVINYNKAGAAGAGVFKQLCVGQGTSAVGTFYDSFADDSGDETLYVGVRLWHRNGNGTDTEVSGGVVRARGSRTWEGFLDTSQYQLSGTYAINERVILPIDVLMVRLYWSINNSTWNVWDGGSVYAAFNTESLLGTVWNATTLTFYYNIIYLWDEAATTEISFMCYSDEGSWGYSRMENFTIFFEDPVPPSTDDAFANGFAFGSFLLGIIAFAVILLYTKH